MTLLQLIGGHMRRHWRPYAASALMLSTIAVLTVWIPRQVGHVVDELVAHRLTGWTLAAQLGLLVLAGLCIYLLRVGWRLALYATAYELGRGLRQRLYDQMTRQGPAFFHSQRTGDLMALATNDIDAIEMAAGEALLAAFDGSLTFILVVSMMTLGVDLRLGLAALAPFPFMAYAFWRISEKVHQAWSDSLTRFSALNQQVQDSLAGVRTVRALGLVGRSRAQFGDLARHAGEASYQAQRWEAMFEPAVGLSLTAATVIALGAGAWLVARAEISIGQLTAFTMYLAQLIWPMFAAGWVLSLLERGRAGWTRLQPVLNAPDGLKDEGQEDMPADAAVTWEHIDFSYPGMTVPALSGIDLHLPPGRTLGIVGATGSGKSTLLRLLLRQYEPTSGRMLLGGVEAPRIRLAALRRAIAWVPQEPFLFSASIADNIALARPQASREEVMAVAALAAVHEDVAELAQGYDTLVGERGVTLSGGQRQRVAIARALLAASPLLLLDDALSAVDSGTEAEILSHWRELRRQHPERSLVVVGHRLSSVMEADEIVVLKQGRIIERGDHAALLALNGWYASQWRYQQLEASLDAA
ncbi:ATP-binding cassette, subfamily B, multidrug efflux pump [Roseateles sp. YR242]|uniref:ABC transporter ATP-binding protein n=1 Tax=Roseateles sp. YR242 TaxID=1855305 RepID=UPI0008BB02E2|nr:ABC transporter transmembrane domain-containing protein [Roseateles sp. YR242]SEK95604.1 ATP-binding cassette, subfamily B, multidrug efflux pump [Roseateles sp. YR242]